MLNVKKADCFWLYGLNMCGFIEDLVKLVPEKMPLVFFTFRVNYRFIERPYENIVFVSNAGTHLHVHFLGAFVVAVKAA